MEQTNNKNGKLMFGFIIIALILIIVVGITYAFFNYTRTGTANTIKTGRIAFNTTEGDTVTLDGLFPISLGENEEITPQTPGVGSLVINVTGDTTYEEGLEYLVKAVNVTGSNGTSLPISIVISYEANGQGKTIGEADDDYFTNRGGNSSVYKVLSTDTISDNGDLVVGYIAPDATGINGNITIMAYLDARNIAITDTIENGNIEVSGYDNGTTSTWIDGRTVFTTEEWNALTANGVSFQVKVEAKEGTWVTAPVAPVVLPTIASCPGCVFKYATQEIYTSWSSDETPTVLGSSDYSENYEDVMTASGKEFFLGMIIDTNTNTVSRAFACGLYTDPGTSNKTPFCIEGTENGEKSSDNRTLLQGSSLWNGTCTGNLFCDSDYVAANDGADGFVGVGDDSTDCTVSADGTMVCE